MKKDNILGALLISGVFATSTCLMGCGSTTEANENTTVVESSVENTVENTVESIENKNGETNMASGEATVENSVEKTEDSNFSTGAAAVDMTELQDDKETADEISAQIDIEAKTTQDGCVAVFITNNSHTIIDDMEVQVNFKDASGNTIDVDTDGHDVLLPGRTVVSRMEAPDSGFESAEVQYQISIDEYYHYENHAEDVAVSTNAGNDCIIVEITNNSDVTIDEVEYDVVLFKGDDVVTIFYPEDLYDVLPGSTRTEKEDTYNWVYGEDYDRIEVYLNQAHTFGY